MIIVPQIPGTETYGVVPEAPEVRVFIYTDSLCSSVTNIQNLAAYPDDVQWKMALTLHLGYF
jgi:hypothetical protein